MHEGIGAFGLADTDVHVERAAVARVIVGLLAVVDVGGCKIAVAEAGVADTGAHAAGDRVLFAVR